MKKFVKVLSLVIALLMVLAVFAACGKDDETTKQSQEPLVVGYSPFSEKFSPFFSTTAYDQDVQAMTQVSLLTSDRTGAIVYKGIKGETIAYGGKDYTYTGPADLTVTENEDGTVYYDFVIRDDIKFSDGVKLTIDDVIFSMYVLCDPTYDGSSTLYALPIKGVEEYRSGMTSRSNAILSTEKKGYTANDQYTEAQYNAYWDAFDKGGEAFAQGIVDYCLAKYAAYGATNVSTSAALWGFSGLAADATAKDFWEMILNHYGYNLSAIDGEAGNISIFDAISANYGEYANDFMNGVKTGDSADNISGIVRLSDTSVRVILTKVDATAIYQLGIAICPLHYYGTKELYDYANNKFGFVKGDLSAVRSKTTKPMGAGAYKFVEYKNGVVYFEANDTYYKGTPKTKYVQFKECLKDDDKLNGVLTDTIDITDPSISTDVVKAITKANGGNEETETKLNGNKVVTSLVDNLGYGYIGMNAYVMKVGNDGSSEASKNLRKAFGTVFSVFRDVAISSYYGARAAVINYPISNTSWAAPRLGDEGYKVAFSTDVEGKAIYTSDMTDEQKYAAAINAALGFFQAAGYTVENGKVTKAPEGASLEYEAWIPGDGTGDHPSFMIYTEAQKALATIGITLKIKDLTNSSDLWDALDAKQVAIWAAAWQATADPDMYQIYYSDVANNGSLTETEGKNPLGGPNQGGSNYEYCIADAQLDKLIIDARSTTDQALRKTLYKAALDIVIDWATEIPTYQRQNCIIFNPGKVDMSTVTPDITPFYGWASEIENIVTIEK